MIEIKGFLDESGRVKAWPSKKLKKMQVLTYLAQKFEFDRIYKESEVNQIIDSWHTFGDLFILRRGLIEARLLYRKADGSEYWRAGQQSGPET